jgi:hypothetical protein
MMNPTYAEAVYMAGVKRQGARRVLSSLIEAYGVFSHEAGPGLAELLAYFNNTVYAIELLLKVLSEDWGPDGKAKSENIHNVGAMYRKAMGRDYAASDLMTQLQRAIKDQKFLFEPYNGLLDRVPEMEALWQELVNEYRQRNWGKVDHVSKRFVMPENFAKFLWEHAELYYRPDAVTLERRTKEQRVELLRFQIGQYQREIDRLCQSEETGPSDMPTQMEQLTREFESRVASLKFIMALRVS